MHCQNINIMNLSNYGTTNRNKMEKTNVSLKCKRLNGEYKIKLHQLASELQTKHTKSQIECTTNDKI